MQTTFIAAGDSFITRRVPQEGYFGLDALRDLIAEHDVRFANLEMTFHAQEAAPAAASGGTWAATDPVMLDDMLDMGFNLFNTANNHSGDFGQEGVAATIRHLRERNMVFAGTGLTLQEASQAAYLETPEARIALIGVTSAFDPAAVAGGQGFRMQGRPGLNPLRYKTIYHVKDDLFDSIQKIAASTDINAFMELTIELGYAAALPEGTMRLGKLEFVRDTENFSETIPDARDCKRIYDEIREARRQADIVLLSLHTHEMIGKDFHSIAQFARTFCHGAIDAGAHVVIGHGPHMMRGIERYGNGIIFHSMGNFIFQTETIAAQPYDAFVNMGLDQDTRVGQYMDWRSADGTRGYPVMPEIWRAYMPSWTIEDGHITEVMIHPIDLGMGKPRSQRGWPRLSKSEETLEFLRRMSLPLGCDIEIENGVGRITL